MTSYHTGLPVGLSEHACIFGSLAHILRRKARNKSKLPHTGIVSLICIDLHSLIPENLSCVPNDLFPSYPLSLKLFYQLSLIH